MDDIDLREEKRQEYLQDAKEDARHEERMRTEYDYVLEYLEDEFDTIRESYENIQNVLYDNGWDCSEYNILEEIKERL
jgi:hypothetical protein